MKLLWSPDLSLATNAIHLASPRILSVLEGDDLHSYAAARLLSAEVAVFQPEPLASLARQVAFNEEGIPEFDNLEQVQQFSEPLLYFGALERIYEANPNALTTLLHDPWSLPSDAVSSYVGYFKTNSEQEEVHQTLHQAVVAMANSICREAGDETYFLTGNPLLARLYLEGQPTLTKASTLALLATAGIRFSLPRLAAINEDELAKVHKVLAEERKRYLDAMNGIILESYSALKSGDVAEAYRFADFHVTTKLERERSKFEDAAGKLESSAAKRLGLHAVKGIPAITRALLTSGAALAGDAGIAILSILTGFLVKSAEKPKPSEQYPLGSFAYRIQGALRDHTPSQVPSFIVKHDP